MPENMTHVSASSGTMSATQQLQLWGEAQVAVIVDRHSFLLDDGRLARQAPSCLISPEVGDTVLTIQSRSGEHFILHLLTRNREEEAQLHVPHAHQLTVCQPRIALTADDGIAVTALRDVEITAATGTLSLAARNLFSSVQDTLVQSMRHYIGKAEHYLLDAAQLLKLHGKETIVTAEQDVKVDGERISVG